MYEESKLKSLRQRFDIDSLHTAIWVTQMEKASLNEMKEPFSVNSVPTSNAEREWVFTQMKFICTPNPASQCTSTISYLLFLNLVGPSPWLNSIQSIT